MAPGRSWYQRATAGIKYITVHHTASQPGGTDDQIMRGEANAHIYNNGWPGLSYHFIILQSGNIYQLNNFTDVTYHDAVNWDSIGICLIGYFHPPVNDNPNTNQLKSLRYVLDQMSTQHPEFPAAEGNVMGHRERSSTACPGNNLIGSVVDYRNKLGKVTWGNYNEPPPDPYEPKVRQLKIAVDRLKVEFDSDFSNPNKEATYKDTMGKIKKIAETGTL